MSNEPDTRRRSSPDGTGIAVGAGVGLAFGVVFNEIAMGLALGTALGAVFEIATRKRNRN